MEVAKKELSASDRGEFYLREKSGVYMRGVLYDTETDGLFPK